MEISWRDYLKLNLPFVLILAGNALGALYALGYRQGMRAMLTAAGDAAAEAHGE